MVLARGGGESSPTRVLDRGEVCTLLGALSLSRNVLFSKCLGELAGLEQHMQGS